MSMFKKLLSLILFSVGYSFLSQAQVFYRMSEFGISGGSSHYFGDLNQNYSFQGLGYSAGLFYKYNFTPYIALKIGASQGNIGFDDKYINNTYQRLRNLNFRSNIYEGALSAEFHFFSYQVGDFDYRFTPYVSIGVAGFYYNPYTTYKDKRYYLRPLGTEGQNYDEYKDRRYTNYSMALPIGLGAKFWFAKGITLHAEIVNRSTMTDYLDDVSTNYVGIDKFQDPIPGPYPSVASLLQDRSAEVTNNPIGQKGRQRGISTTKDQYMFIQFGISFRLPTYKCPEYRR
jgi:hypothetical protein